MLIILRNITSSMIFFTLKDGLLCTLCDVKQVSNVRMAVKPQGCASPDCSAEAVERSNSSRRKPRTVRKASAPPHLENAVLLGLSQVCICQSMHFKSSQSPGASDR